MRVICVARFFGFLFISLTLILGISLTKVESSEPLASDVTPPADSKKDMVAAAGEGSGPVTEKSVAGATQPLSPLSWRVKAGLLVLHREKNDKVTLFTNIAGTELLDARDLNLGVGFGLDASLGVKFRTFGTAFGAEVRYFGINEWSAREGASSTSGVIRRQGITIIYVAGPPNSVGVTGSYESGLHNVELNLSWFPIERIRVFIGGRYINIDEEQKNTMNFSSGGYQTTERITAKNKLLGGQVGVEGVFLGKTDDGFSIDGWAKVGYFNNDISTKAQLSGWFGLYSPRSSKDKSTLGTEFGIGVNYAFTQNIALSARYQLLWLDKVAFAPQQVTVVNYNGRSTVATDSVLYQGGWVGIVIFF